MRERVNGGARSTTTSERTVPVVPLLQRSRQRTQIDPAAFLDATASEYISSLVLAGCLVSIYRTSDGGALGISVTLDGENEKEYFRLPEECHEWLQEVDAAVGETPAPAPSAKRARRGPQKAS